MRLRWKNYIFETDESNADSVYAVCFLGEYNYMIDSLQRADVVIDAGANIGAFSVIASKKVNRIYAVEPHPLAFNLLNANIKLNECSNVVPLNAAISDRTGFAHLVGLGESAHLGESGVLVRTTTLDQITSDKVTVIKMDIEGAESLALRDQPILRDVRAIAVETHDNFTQIVRLLQGWGFNVLRFKTSKADMFRKAVDFDFLKSETQSHFSVSRRAVRYLLNAPGSLYIPTGIIYGSKSSQR